MKDERLEFSDWPMFDRIMMDDELCREILEVILGRPLSRIEYVVAEYDVRPSLSRHGVRLDAFAKAANEVYDIEMQTTNKGDLGRRLRYYQSSIDTASLRRGAGYESLPMCFIIFICKHDAFDRGLPVYTLDVVCAEAGERVTEHGFKWIVLSASHWKEMPDGKLRNLLHYVMTGKVGDDDLSKKIDVAVSRANDDEVWRREKMELLTWEEDMEIQKRIAIRDGLAEGRAKGIEEGRAEGLAEGRVEGEGRFAALVVALTEAGRSEDIQRAAADAGVRAELLAEFGIS